MAVGVRGVTCPARRGGRREDEGVVGMCKDGDACCGAAARTGVRCGVVG